MTDELKTQLTDLGFPEDQITKLAEQGVTSPAEMAMLNEGEIRDITGCTVIVAKKTVVAFAPEPAPVTMEPTASFDLLPKLPDDVSFLDMLKVGGTLKLDPTNVIAAMRAAIAARVGLYDLPDTLLQRMEDFALEQDEPVGDAFYRLQQQRAERRYGDILTAIGATGNFMSDKRKRETLGRLDQLLWPALLGFNTQLQSWVTTWSQGAANPAVMMMAFMTHQGAGAVLPPGMMQPPDTSVLRDEGEAVINRINQVFAGTGIPVARALAYDAMRIRQALEDPSLPSAVGAATRDQMLKTLGIDVGADLVRLEQNTTRFALGIMELPKVAQPEELAYFTALWQLGNTIPWDRLSHASTSSNPRVSGRYKGPDPIRGDVPTRE